MTIESLKTDEQLFRKVVGNVPESSSTQFKPNGLDGDSWTFYKNKNSGIWYLKRHSSGEELTIIDYVMQAQGIGFNEAVKFLDPDIEFNKLDWFQSHGLTPEYLESIGCKVEKNKVAFPVKSLNGELIGYQYRNLFAKDKKERFYFDKGVSSGKYCYYVDFFVCHNLIITAGQSDCINLYRLEESEGFMIDSYDVVGFIGESSFPSEVKEWIKKKELNSSILIAFDNDETGFKRAQKVKEEIQKLNPNLIVKAVTPEVWEGFNANDISELAAKKGLSEVAKFLAKLEKSDQRGQKEDKKRTNEKQPISRSGSSFSGSRGQRGQEDKKNNLSEEEFNEKLKETLETFEYINKEQDLNLFEILDVDTADHLYELSEGLQFPAEHVLTMFLPIAASCIGKARALVYKGGGGWREPAALFAFALAESGTGKSPASSALLSPLEDIQKEFKKKHQEELKNHKKHQTEAIANGEEPAEEPKKPVFYVTGTTLESVGKNRNPNNGILYVYDEALDFISDLVGYRQGVSNATGWNRVWGCKTQYVQRVKDDREVESLASSLLALGHPYDTMKEFKKVSGIDIEDTRGIFSRYLICSKTSERQKLSTEPNEVNIYPFLYSLYTNLLNSSKSNGDEWLDFEFSNEASKALVKLQNLTIDILESHPDQSYKAIFFPKMLSNICRIALVLHCLQAAVEGVKPNKTISKDTFNRAANLGIYYFHQSQHVFRYGEEFEEPSDRFKKQLESRFQKILDYASKSKTALNQGYVTVKQVKEGNRFLKDLKLSSEEIIKMYLNPLIEKGFLEVFQVPDKEVFAVKNKNLSSLSSCPLQILDVASSEAKDPVLGTSQNVLSVSSLSSLDLKNKTKKPLYEEEEISLDDDVGLF